MAGSGPPTWSPPSDLAPTHWIVIGALLAISTQVLLAGIYRLSTKGGKHNASIRTGEAIYGLEHGKLNLTLPPASMWMNMGFWQDVESDDFVGACRALLHAVLKQAGLLEPATEKVDATLRKDLKNISVMDVGFGCGDQTLSIADLAGEQQDLRYLGITLNSSQCTYAQRRLSLWKKNRQTPSRHDISLFLGDAANPDSWASSCLEKAAAIISSSTSSERNKPPSPDANQAHEFDKAHQQQQELQPETTSATVLLALDTLYHFSPSRQPLLTYAARTLRADLAAFDILLSDDATAWQTLRLRAVGVLSGCPWNAFLTEREYRSMLAAAGYAAGGIVVQDVTEHVFGPLSQFMAEHEGRLEGVGLKMGSLRVAGTLFGWWARSKVVRGVIVTARAS
ncbi:cyclopropane-fatty-acyl-phospholipid synthase [Microdochium nivale]|nr:cyclopropane-fatty-acyl-phospholipid synthase [Microdochium nivale]